jgi:hypothetical protein
VSVAAEEPIARAMRQVASANGSAPEQAAGEDSWRPRDLATIEDAPPALPTILAGADGRGLLYSGKRHLITGRPEAAKSWLGCAAILDVVRRQGVAGVFVDFDAMGAGVFKERMTALGTSPAELGLCWYLEPDRPFDEAAGSWWDARLAEGAVGLVWLDAQNPGLELHGLKPNSDDDVARFQRLVVGRFHRAGVATAVVDHLPKDPDASAEYAINSQRKVAGVDVHLRMELAGEPLQRGGKPTSVLLRVMKDRPSGFDRSATKTVGRLVFTPEAAGGLAVAVDMIGGAAPDGDGPAPRFRPTHLMERISRFLEVQTAPASQRDVEAEVKGNRDAKRTALRVLIDEGHVVRDREGQAWMHRSEQPYREADDPASDRFDRTPAEGSK